MSQHGGTKPSRRKNEQLLLFVEGISRNLAVSECLLFQSRTNLTGVELNWPGYKTLMKITITVRKYKLIGVHVCIALICNLWQ